MEAGKTEISFATCFNERVGKREREREREMEKVGGLRKRWQDGDIRRGISSGYLNSGYSVGEHAESGSFLTEIQGDILLVART